MINANPKNLNQQFISQILHDLHTQENLPLSQILQTATNLLMQAERELHLESNPSDKANGFFQRKLGTPMGTLELNVPRDRDGDFRPAILPEPYQRDYDERKTFLESLMTNGYSPNQIADTLKSMNLHYNPEEIETLQKHYSTLFEQWQTRELPEDVIALFIDAYHAEALVDSKVRKVVVYVIIGIDFTGTKSLFGLYLYTGSESKAFWLQTLNQLIHRKLKCPLFVISDDFSGLKNAVNTLFPQTHHQLCFIHMQRNVRRNMGLPDAQNFNNELARIKLLSTHDEACSKFTELCNQYQKKYPHFIAHIKDNSQNYFNFMRLPNEIRKYFYTTNAVESFNSMLEKIRQRSGGFFQSEQYLKVNVFMTVQKLYQTHWKHGIPILKGHMYSINQLFAQAYSRAPNSISFQPLQENTKMIK